MNISFKNLKPSKESLISFTPTFCIALVFSWGMAFFLDRSEIRFISEFVDQNQILDIYWNTLLIPLTILVPVGIEALQFLRKDLPKIGGRIYFQYIAKTHRLSLLLPVFSFSLLFAGTKIFNDHGEYTSAFDERILTGAHALSFFLWITLFWYILEVLRTSVGLFSENYKWYEIYKKAMANSGGYLPRETGFNEFVLDLWQAFFKKSDSFEERWRREFLVLFWDKQESYFREGQYGLVSDLFSQLDSAFLSPHEGEEKDVVWFNSRKRWLWFHDEKFNDKEENPYAVFVRFLPFYRNAHRQWTDDIGHKDGRSLEQGSFSLQNTLKDILKRIVDQELEHSDDYCSSLFRHLKKHVEQCATGIEEDTKYIHSIPMYETLFNHADNLELRYSEFPKEWRFGVDAEPLLGSEGNALMRRIWLGRFSQWFGQRIGHGKKEYDPKLEGAIELFFPGAYVSWIGSAFAYRVLSWGGSRADSFCRWEKNFGFGFSGGVHDVPSGLSPEEEGEYIGRRLNEEMESAKDTAAIIVGKLGLLGGRDQLEKLKREFDALNYPEKSLEEDNRKEMVELIDRVLKKM